MQFTPTQKSALAWQAVAAPQVALRGLRAGKLESGLSWRGGKP
jgi:hypothetical protein